MAVTNPSLDCDFDKIDQCGYLDASPGKVHWTRFYSQDSQGRFPWRTFVNIPIAHIDTS